MFCTAVSSDSVCVRSFVTLCLLLFCGETQADVMISFANGDAFEGDAAGDIAGTFTDPASGVSFDVATVAIGGGGTALNPNAGTLGIVGGGNNSRFDAAESWTFNFSSDINLTGIDLGFFDGIETATLVSTAWANAVFNTPGPDISFLADATAGVFTFGAGSSSDAFTTSDFTSMGFVSVASGTDLTFTYTGTGNMVLQSLTVAASTSIAAVPEPATWTLLLVALSTVVIYRARLALRSKTAKPFLLTRRSTSQSAS